MLKLKINKRTVLTSIVAICFMIDFQTKKFVVKYVAKLFKLAKIPKYVAKLNSQ